MAVLQCCPNGGRQASRVPTTPADLGELARRLQRYLFGLHVHPRDERGIETLEPRHIGSSVSAIRSAAPALEIGVSTGAWITPSIEERLAQIRAWDACPDVASVNFHEDGAIDVARALIERGVEIEAGLWNRRAAEVFVGSDVVQRTRRVLLEPMEADVDEAIQCAMAMERTLDDAGVLRPRLLHGNAETAWPVFRWAAERGYLVRIGLEDTLVDADGEDDPDNEELVVAADRLIRSLER